MRAPLSISPKRAVDELAAIYKEKTRKIVFWVGAGLSRTSSIPDWNGLREGLLDIAEEKAMSLDEKSRDEIRHKIVAASEEPNNWAYFRKIRETLGDTTYKSAIRQYFSDSSTHPIPFSYDLLWKIENNGIITTKFDSFCQRSFIQHKPEPFFTVNSNKLVVKIMLFPTNANI